jgi:hypothetical protein
MEKVIFIVEAMGGGVFTYMVDLANWIYVNTLDNNLGFLFFTCYLDNQNIN